ncbi:MAG: nucleoside deaminase [Verrucomicrobiae bacterium]|nr:nucleoside deaminase [Verrucomicrobiae bacterium]
MREALRSARLGMRRGHGGPFGACLVRGRQILAIAHNRVLQKLDATCHAEIQAIREASRKLGTPFLEGAVIYSSTEPCPMCFSAIHWARIGRVVYGTAIRDVARRGFHELSISNRRLRALGRSPVQLNPGFLLEECRELLAEWDRLPSKRTY